MRQAKAVLSYSRQTQKKLRPRQIHIRIAVSVLDFPEPGLPVATCEAVCPIPDRLQYAREGRDADARSAKNDGFLPKRMSVAETSLRSLRICPSLRWRCQRGHRS
jgi:hypothetical protein